MIDLRNPLNNFIRDKIPVEIPTIINEQFLDTEGLAVCCKQPPAEYKDRKYIVEGYVDGKRMFDYVCRSRNATEAQLVLDLLLELLENLELEVYGGVAQELDHGRKDKPEMFLSCEAVSAPMFVGIDDKGHNYYQCSIEVTFNTP